jgi:hypothetical protein
MTYGFESWYFNIFTSSSTLYTHIWRVQVEWTGTALLKRVALRSKPIWADYFGVPSLADLTFPYTSRPDLYIPPTLTLNQLQLTFDTNDFTIKHVKVFFENGCFVQYYSTPYP